MRIRTRLWILVTMLLGLVLAGNAFFVINLETREINGSFERENLAFATLAGPQALRAYGEGARREMDGETDNRLAAIAQGLPQLKAMVLYSPRGKLLAGHPRGADAPSPEFAEAGQKPVGVRRLSYGGEDVLELVVPVKVAQDGPPAFFQVLVSEAPVKERLASIKAAYVASFAFLFSVGAFLALYVAKTILRPVESLKEAAKRLKDGDLDARAPISGGGEMRELAVAFNDMAEKLEDHLVDQETRNSALKEAYGELQALYAELSELERAAAVGRTAAAVSHEIDNPIGVILGTAGMLKREYQTDPSLQEDLALIEEECLRCRRIVRDLLALSKPHGSEAGAVDLAAVAARIIRGVAHHPELRGIEFKTVWPDDLPLAQAEEDEVRQVFLNLFLNAGKAAGYGGAVEICGGFDDRTVYFEVMDRGPGILPENLEKIFMPYFTTGQGSGLGLFVSRRLMTGAGGRLTAANREGGGSVFTAVWPRKVGDES